MKIQNYNYRRVTFWNTNSWKAGGRHLTVFQVFPDISISLIYKHTNTTQANLVYINTDDVSKILDMTSWVSHYSHTNRRWFQALWQHPGGHVPKGLEVLVGWRKKVRIQWWRRLQQESGIHIPGSTFTTVLRSFSPTLFPYLLQYLWTVFFVPGAVQYSGDKQKTCSQGT